MEGRKIHEGVGTTQDCIHAIKSKRIVANGCPLLPYLFLIVMEWLSRALNLANMAGKIHGLSFGEEVSVTLNRRGTLSQLWAVAEIFKEKIFGVRRDSRLDLKPNKSSKGGSIHWKAINLAFAIVGSLLAWKFGDGLKALIGTDGIMGCGPSVSYLWIWLSI